MTNIVTTPAAPDIPQYPAMGSPSFNEESYEYASKMPAASVRIREIALAAEANASVAEVEASDARASAARAETAADIAGAYTNMRGDWSGLSGPLAPPATVYHAGQFWALLRPLPDVAASEPGNSDDWAPAFTVTDQILATMNAVALSM